MSYNKLEFDKKFQVINDSFISPDIQSAFTGSTAKAASFGIGGLDNYSEFLTAYTVSGQNKTPFNPSASGGPVLVKDSNNNYIQLISSANYDLTELNFYVTLGVCDISSILQNLRNSYGLLSNFNDLKSGNEVSIKSYIVKTVNSVKTSTVQKYRLINGFLNKQNSAITYIPINSNSDVLNIFNFNKLLTDESTQLSTDLFALQRIILMQELMIHCYLAMQLYTYDQANIYILKQA